MSSSSPPPPSRMSVLLQKLRSNGGLLQIVFFTVVVLLVWRTQSFVGAGKESAVDGLDRLPPTGGGLRAAVEAPVEVTMKPTRATKQGKGKQGKTQPPVVPTQAPTKRSKKPAAATRAPTAADAGVQEAEEASEEEEDEDSETREKNHPEWILKPPSEETAPSESTQNEPEAAWQCAAPLGFLPDGKRRRRAVTLASFPGSGNTWMRYLLEQGSRVYTGSVYNDEALLTTYPGEGTQDASVVAVKSHYPCPKCWTQSVCPVCGAQIPVKIENTNRVENSDAVVFIMRSPFDAILAEYMRVKTQSHAGVVELAPEEFTKPGILRSTRFRNEYTDPSWAQFVSQRLYGYKTAARRFLSRAVPRTCRSPACPAVRGADFRPSDLNVTEGSNVVMLPNNAPTKKELSETDLFAGAGGELVKLVFFERLKTDLRAEMTSVFRFLNNLFEDEGLAAPYGTAEEAGTCAYQEYLKTEKEGFQWLRKAKKKFNPYRPEQIQQVCDYLGDWWFEDVWGDCRKGLLQWERDLPSDSA